MTETAQTPDRVSFLTVPDWRRLLVDHPVAAALGLAVASRLFFVLVASLSYASVEAWTETQWNRGPTWVHPFARWDSGYYLVIATDGYGAFGPNWAFHPGYPLLVRALQSVVPGLGPEVAGFLLSNACFLAALPVFLRLTERVYGTAMAWRASLAVAVFPGGFFFTAIYPESAFFLTLVLSLSAFQRRRWMAAGVWAACAHLFRPQGLFLIPAYLMAAAWDRWRGHGRDWSALAAPALAILGPLGHSLFAAQKTGDPLAWTHAREVYWDGVGLHDPIRMIGFIFNVPDKFGLPALGLLLFVAAAVYGAVRRFDAPFVGAFAAHMMALLLLGVHLFYSEAVSFLRFCIAALPIFWMLGHASMDRRGLALVVLLSLGFAGLVAFLFATWRYAI